MAIVKSWYTRSGRPTESQTITDSDDHHVVGQVNPTQVGDVVITEGTYDAFIIQNDLDIKAAFDSAVAAAEVINVQIRAKLVAGTPLTADEAARVI